MFIGGFTLFEIESKATGVKNVIIYTLLGNIIFCTVKSSYLETRITVHG